MHAPPDGSLDFDLVAHAQSVVRNQIERLRKREGLTQAQAGARVGWDQSYWSRVENGGLELKLEHLLNVQFALELDSVEALFGSLPSQRVKRGRAPD